MADIKRDLYVETTMKLTNLKVVPVLHDFIAVLWGKLGENKLKTLENVKETDGSQ
jgi:hypothetical protein